MKLNIKKILVPVDFSSTSIDALDYGAFIAEKLGADLAMLHVLESYQHNVVLTKDSSDTNEIIMKGILSKFDEIINKKKLTALKIKTICKPGKIYKVIEETAKKGNFDLIVMGTHGASGFKNIEKLMLGSNAYRTVHSSPCPVLTMRGKKRTVRFKNILLPLDVTKDTTQKVSFAIEWAKAFESTIHVISVSRPFDEFIVDVPRMKYQLKEVISSIKSSGIACTSRFVRSADVAKTVISYAAELNADLTIIMTREEQKWNELFIGSSARTVITESNTPVLSVRPKKAMQWWLKK